MDKMQNIKVFACGEIPSVIVKGRSLITKQFDDYVKLNNFSFSKYYIKGFLKKEKDSVKCINLYEKHEKSNLRELKKSLDKSDMVIILGDLKDKHFSSNIEKISKVAKEKGALVLAMVLIPYSTDKNEQMKYDTSVQYLCNRVDTFIPILAEKMAVDCKTPLVSEEGIEFSQAYMLFCLEQLMLFFIDDGLVKLNKKDFNEIFKNSGLGCISIGYGSGEDKIENALKLALSSNRKIIECNKLLVGISGGDGMKLSSVKNIIKRIEDTVHKDASITFAAFIDDEVKDDFAITIIGIENI